MRRDVALGGALLLAAATVMLGVAREHARPPEFLDDATPPVPPPAGARVLFDGRDLSAFASRHGGPAAWKLVAGGAVEVVPGSGDIETRESFGDFDLHVEFAVPRLLHSIGQSRGNSGVFLRGTLELQILDAWRDGLGSAWPVDTEPDRNGGAIYGVAAARTNASREPGRWQSYDVTTHGNELSVTWNGTIVHDRVHVDHGTGSDAAAPLAKSGTIRLQDHGAHVRFRDLWIVAR